MVADTPAADVELDAEIVGRLIAEQFPDLAGEPVALLASGWDNWLFRVGETHVARLPRREIAVPLVEHEQRWLPVLAPRLPLPVPVPVGAGAPGAGYPWPWSLCPLLPGRTVLADLHATGSLAEPAEMVDDLAAFLRALHVPAPAEAPHNPYRGVPLRDRDATTRDRLDLLAGAGHDLDAMARSWQRALDVPTHTGPPLWLHGDMHPGNLVSDGRRLTGVIDFGDLCAGDPASDLVVAWMLFDAPERGRLRSRLDVDDHTWDWARGWALSIGLALLTNSADNPPYTFLGERTVAAVIDEQPG